MCDYIGHESNRFNMLGSCASIVELSKMVPDIEAAWKAKRKQDRTVRAASSADRAGTGGAAKTSYEEEYHQLIKMDYEGASKSWQGFGNTRVFHHWEENAGLVLTFCESSKSQCDKTDTGFSSAALFSLGASLSKALAKDDSTYIDVALLVLKLMIPTYDGWPWILRDRKDAVRLKGLLVPMQESRVLKRYKHGANKNAMSKLSVKATTPSSGTRKAKAQPELRQSMKPACEKMHDVTPGRLGLHNAINYVPQAVPETKIMFEEVERVTITGLLFFLEAR
eukprot:NODE_83_length_2194_cov_267.997662.p1 GENE.NODE_83_length_2194_cov_267.997662~~NODE_83_length_2194_cov_267.997662.p1  ORF type:complete len:280 (-),score=52.85 NODE_83_length_2194_cov_267.997662:916-1755(-)